MISEGIGDFIGEFCNEAGIPVLWGKSTSSLGEANTCIEFSSCFFPAFLFFPREDV